MPVLAPSGSLAAPRSLGASFSGRGKSRVYREDQGPPPDGSEEAHDRRVCDRSQRRPDRAWNLRLRIQPDGPLVLRHRLVPLVREHRDDRAGPSVRGRFLAIAANWGYANGNTFGATAFGTYSAFFLTFAFAHIGIKLDWWGAVPVAHLVGILAVSFVLMTTIYWLASFRIHLALNLALFFLLLVFLLYAIPLLTLNHAGTSTAFGSFPAALAPAGYFGMIDVAMTVWIGAAAILNDQWRRTGAKTGPIPLFPFRPSTMSTSGSARSNLAPTPSGPAARPSVGRP